MRALRAAGKTRSSSGTKRARSSSRESESRLSAADSETARKKAVVEVIREVARRLRNTMAVCRKCYVHPDVLTAFMADTLQALPAPRSAIRLRADEARLLALLESTQAPAAAARKAA